MKRVAIFIAGFLLVPLSALSQGHTENKADQALRGSGRVNSSTLGMEISIPLASFPGRGINVPISLSYSSKVWRMDYKFDTPGGVVSGGCRSVNEAKYGEDSASGWTTSLGTPYIEYVGRDNQFNSQGLPLGEATCPDNPPPPHSDNAYIRRLVVRLPSGETHELRADDTPQHYAVGSMCPPSGGYSCDPNDPSLQASWDRTYYAVDGSNIRYVENSASSPTATYALLMPDGSRYDFEGSLGQLDGRTVRKALKFTDRNGNFTVHNTTTGAWTDTLGRTLMPPIGPTAPNQPTAAGQPIEYSIPGMTGKYKFHWKRLKGSSAAESGLTDFNQNLKYRGPHIHHISNGNWALRSAGTFLFNSTSTNYVLSGADVFNPIVLTEIELPTGQSYKFTYDIYGLIEKVSYPTGGDEVFDYEAVVPLTPSTSDNVTDQANFGVVNRKLYPLAGGTHYEWTYSASYATPSGYKVSMANPDGTSSERYLHRGTEPCVGEHCTEGTFGYDNVLAGMAYETRSYDASSPRKLIAQSLTLWTSKSFPQVGIGTPSWHPRVVQEETRIFDTSGNGVSSTAIMEYEGDLHLRETPVLANRSSQYAFVTVGSALPSNPVKVAETTYLISDPNYAGVKSYYTAQNMNGLVTVSQVKDGAGTIASRTETVYDESGRSPGYRGNPTSLRVWDSTKGIVTNTSAYISTSARFDIYGNQYEATDAKGNTTTTTFDLTHHAYPIQVTSPIPSDGVQGSSTAFVTTATFDPVTGLALTTTDANGLETRITYDPVTLRPLNTKTYYNNVQVGSTVETIYNDQPNNYWVKNRSQIDEHKWAETITYFDGLGRAWKSEEVNSGGNIFVEKEFDADGRVLRVSNPFRTGETKYWTTNVYDEASRVKEVILQDGATVKTDYGVSIAAPIGVTKQITDQAGKKRKGITDALGRMIRVIEDPTGQNLSTDYVFDTLGNLRKTVQGEQSRFFMHDSLGRLLYAKQPEQDTNANFVATDPVTGNTAWSVKYEFDDNGNIERTTDARGVYIQGAYDNLNRLKARDYSDATPDVTFYYDGTGWARFPLSRKARRLAFRAAFRKPDTRALIISAGFSLTSREQTVIPTRPHTPTTFREH